MQFLNLQLRYDNQQLTLGIQTHQNTEHFQLHGAVSDQNELAQQAELFVGIHLRPYFDLLPVDSCQLTVSQNVPEDIRNACISELLKITKTNEFLKQYRNPEKVSEDICCARLVVYTSSTSSDALASMVVLNQSPDSLCLAYMPGQKSPDQETEHLQLFCTDIEGWYTWYLSLGCDTLVCSADFITEFERYGVVLSSLLVARGHALVILDSGYQPGVVYSYYEKRAVDSRSIVRFEVDEKSLVWARWLGLCTATLGPMPARAARVESRDIVQAFRNHQGLDLKLASSAILDVQQQPVIESLSILMCEDLYFQRLQAWLPQAYFVKKVLDEHCSATLSPLAAAEIWLSVMRRLIVGSNESTDYDVIVLCRRLELIADAVHSLSLIEFIEDLKGKADVKLCGRSDWQSLFPEFWVDGFDAHQWREAMNAFPEAGFVSAQPVFNPCFSDMAVECAYSGRRAAFVSSYHQLCSPHGNLQKDGPLEWLAFNNIINADGCCVHLLTHNTDTAELEANRLALVTMLSDHNQELFGRINTKEWVSSSSPLQHLVDRQLENWHFAVAEFFEDHSTVFQETLMVLNPAVDIGITDSLRGSAPTYLKRVLDMMPGQQTQDSA